METEKHMNEMLRLFDRSLPDLDEISKEDIDLHLEHFLKTHVDEIRCTYYSVPGFGIDITVPERADIEIVLINIPGLEKEISMTQSGMSCENCGVSCYHTHSYSSGKFVDLLFDVCLERFPKRLTR